MVEGCKTMLNKLFEKKRIPLLFKHMVYYWIYVFKFII